MAKTDLTAQRLRELLHYTPDTGIFTWRRTGKGINLDRSAGCLDGRGYLAIMIDGGMFRGHRLAWLYANGAWPIAEIDHINGTRSDNRIANLREATTGQNRQNQRQAMGHNNSSRLLGTSWNPVRGKWQASIRFDGRAHFLGRFETVELAHAAYLIAKRKHHEFGAI